MYWAGFFLLEYWDKHPNDVMSFQYYRYTSLTLFLGVIGAAISFLVSRKRDGLISKFYNGFAIYILGLIIVCCVAYSYNRFVFVKVGTELVNIPLEANNYMTLCTRLTINFFSSYLMVISCYSLGNFILKKYFSNYIKRKHFSYDFGLGAIIFTLVLFFLAVFGLLKPFVVLPIVIVMMVINWRGTLDFFLRTFIKPIQAGEGFGFWSCFVLFGLLVFLLLNVMFIDLPFPMGFDSRNFYMNISNQLGTTDTLVSGYQPYSWALFVSSGIVIFDRIETTLFLSFLTGVLCLFCVFHLAYKHFKLTHLQSVLAAAFLATIPAYANQFFVELKTDFGLVLFQLISLSLLMDWLLKTKTKETRLIAGVNRRSVFLLSLLGLFIGFALGIKLLNLFFIYAIVIVIWKTNGGYAGIVGLFLIMFSLVLILQLNNISGLDLYHLGNGTARWIYLLAGVSILVFAMLRNMDNAMLFMKRVTIIGVFALIPLLPWIGKNYTETKSLSPRKLLLGEQPGPKINNNQIFREMERTN